MAFPVVFGCHKPRLEAVHAPFQCFAGWGRESNSEFSVTWLRAQRRIWPTQAHVLAAPGVGPMTPRASVYLPLPRTTAACILKVAKPHVMRCQNTKSGSVVLY